MNQSDKIEHVFINKTDDLNKGKRLHILLFSDNQYFTGFFQGYSHVAGFKIKILPPGNFDNLFEILITESPSVLIIDMTQAAPLFNSQGWTAAWSFIQRSQIALCGVGKKSPDNYETLPKSVFNKIFIEPVNFHEIEHFLEATIVISTFIHDRRQSKERRKNWERRSGQDQRKSLEGYKAAYVSIPVNLENQIDKPKLENTLHVGPLVINYLARTITLKGVPVEITPKEFQFIDLLAQQPDCVVKVEEIIKNIWPDNKKATKADVHQYAYILRNKLEENPHEPKILLTVKGFGYRLCS